jgi:15-cis-phytoene synthase
MQDAFAHCAELVRAADKDRYLAALFAPARLRPALFALYAFNIEVARVRDVAREPLPGEIRLQWWSEVLHGERGSEAGAHPVASALLATIDRNRLDSTKLTALIDARRFDLYNEPMKGVADLEAYASKTSSALFALAAQILSGAGGEAVAEPAGIAYAIAALLRAFPLHAARRQLYIPIELLDRHRVQTDSILAGQSSAALNAALTELRTVARGHLARARQQLGDVTDETIPAVLPLALVRPLLDRLENRDAFSPVGLLPWRRQWLIWRAARNPARIAG